MGDEDMLQTSLEDLGCGGDEGAPQQEAAPDGTEADDDGTLSLEQYLEEQIRALGGDPGKPEPESKPTNGVKRPTSVPAKTPRPAGKPAEDAPPEPPGVGAVVETTGLSKSELNGLQGKVTRHQGDRVVVELPEPYGEKALRPVNLKVIREAPEEPAAKRARLGLPAQAGQLPGVATPAPTVTVSEAGLYEPVIKYWDTFNAQSKILVVGEGNFSWAWNLCHILGTGENMVCTDAVMNATVGQTCNQYLLPLVEAGATVCMRLDGTRMGKQVLVRRCGQYFDFVVWNFPHTTTPNKAPHSQEEHRQLLTRFLQQAELVLQKGGKASITVKDGYPYNEWRIAGLQPGGKMKYVGCEAFTPERWQIYAHVTTRAGAGVNGSSTIARVFPAHTYVYECQ
eukprot:TRINITY_DN5643_c0_g1_i1.p1 TRINITY_DN5643_c0_g1~~TRINITY_DN5643_c0_g1_i1.p1  ORF type:complete len:396 (+),score=127.73 TRINITY_DN5643_c0_g1_i1:119-1306(+)